MDSKKYFKYAGIVISIVIFILLAWKFTFILWYIIAAAVISFIGLPLVRSLKKIKIGKHNTPNWMAALLALFVIVLAAAAIFAAIIPVIIKQAHTISAINFVEIRNYIEEPLSEFLHKYNIIDQNDTIRMAIENRLNQYLTFTFIFPKVSSFIGNIGKILVGIFSTLFIAFYFLRDENILQKMIMIFVSENYEHKVDNALANIKHFLSKYFIGLIIEVAIMFALESLGLFAIGVKGALLIAFIGALCNVIPYVGPIMGAAFGIISSSLYLMSSGQYDHILLQSLLIVIVFVVCNFIDNTLLQPYIYSTTTNSHPLEIFIVLLLFGSFAGIVGMLLAVPAYTVIKVIAKEFLSNLEITRKWTSKLEIK